MRDAVYDLSLMRRMARDIPRLLGAPVSSSSDEDVGTLELWDEKVGAVPAGRSYADGEEGMS